MGVVPMVQPEARRVSGTGKSRAQCRAIVQHVQKTRAGQGDINPGMVCAGRPLASVAVDPE